MKRLVSISLSLVVAALLVAGCGSDSTPNSLSNSNPGAGQPYQGFVLGRVKLIPTLQAGPVEVRSMDGQLLKTAEAGPQGFFWYEGSLPTDFRLQARRGQNVYESEYHGGWTGGTLYINAGTTLACAYRRRHPEVTPQIIEEKIRSFYELPANFRLSWVSTVRASFDTRAFFAAVANAGSLEGYTNTLIARIDSGIRAKEGSIIGTLATNAAASIFSATVNNAIGDSVANMGYDFTTAGALSTIEDDLQVVSQQVTELDSEFQKAAAAAALQSTLQPLRSNALQINNSVANITDSISDFLETHPDDGSYNVPSNYPAIQDTIGQVNNLDLANLTTPIVDAIVNYGSQGLYQELVKEQMTDLGQSYDTNFNSYPWRTNQLTQQQLQLIGQFALTLQQSAYLQSEYAHLQSGNLAAAMTDAASSMANLAYQTQVAAQQVPDLMLSDELILDQGNGLMWYSAFLGYANEDTAGQVVHNLEIGPYDDWSFPAEADIDSLVRERIGPATNPPISTQGTGNWNSASSSVWQTAFAKMGMDPESYSSSREACWTTKGSRTSDLLGAQGRNDLNLYTWNGNSRNPTTSDLTANNPDLLSLTLAVRGVGGSAERNGDAYLPPPLTVGSHANDTSNTNDHDPAFTVSGLSPMTCGATNGVQTLEIVGTVDKNGTTLGTQLKATTIFLTPAFALVAPYFVPEYYAYNQGNPYDITNRAAWSSDNPKMASVSNYQSDTATSDANFAAPGGCGFVTWHPPLDGSALSAVNVTSKFFSLASPIGTSTLTLETTQVVNPPSSCRPVLTQVYATPSNQIYDVSASPSTVALNLLAFYQDGRIIDVSTNSGTTWELKDANGNVLNSDSTGGFGVLNGSAKNSLYLTSGITTPSVSYTGTYTNQWGTQAFTGNMGLVLGSTRPIISTMLPASGSSTGGQTIVIKGSNFTNPCTVTFNGTPATSTFFVNSTQLSVVTPPGTTGAATVLVNNSDGSTSDPSFYNYTP